MENLENQKGFSSSFPLIFQNVLFFTYNNFIIGLSEQYVLS